MKKYNFIEKQDLNLFKRAKPLPFKITAANGIKFKYSNGFLLGFVVGGLIEFSMIKFGYYQEFIEAERRRLISDKSN
jgi:hypothetical protein